MQDRQVRCVQCVFLPNMIKVLQGSAYNVGFNEIKAYGVVITLVLLQSLYMLRVCEIWLFTQMVIYGMTFSFVQQGSLLAGIRWYVCI